MLKVLIKKYQDYKFLKKLRNSLNEDISDQNSALFYSSANPLVSIILLSYNEPTMTEMCLECIWENTTDIKYEIIVFENGSYKDKTIRSFAEKNKHRVHYISSSENLFYGEGNNFAAEFAKSKYLLFLNNDSFVTNDWLAPLVETLEKNHKAGVVSSKMLFSSGLIQETGVKYTENLKIHKINSRKQNNDEKEVMKADYVSLASGLVRRELFFQLLGFDPVYKLCYSEDADLCFKITACGYDILCNTASVVYHIESFSTRKYIKNLRCIKRINKKKFNDTWGEYIINRKASPPEFIRVPRLYTQKDDAETFEIEINDILDLPKEEFYKKLQAVGFEQLNGNNLSVRTNIPLSRMTFMRKIFESGIDISFSSLSIEAEKSE